MSLKHLTLVVALLISNGAMAETRYVTDRCEVPLRTGETSTHRILQAMSSGTPVSVIAKNKTTGYSLVRTEQGKEGYILSYQLLSDPAAREQLEKALARVAELESAPEQLSGKLASLSREHDELVKQHATISKEKKLLEEELAALRQTSTNAVQIAEERSQLRKQLAQITHEMEDSKAQIQEASNDNNLSWFLTGAGVLLGGLFLGLILPNLKLRRRRDSWGSL